MIAEGRIPVTDKALQFISHRCGRNVKISEMKIQRSPAAVQKKISWARERSCYTSLWGCA